LFTNKESLQTLQLMLMKIIRSRDQASAMTQNSAAPSLANLKTTSVTIQLATMMVATVPILILYPFLQKYFVTGLTIGAVKG